METIEKEIERMRNDPELLEGIRRGMHDFHLGHMFKGDLVFGSYRETGGWFYSRWYCRSIINLKKFWWRLKTPWQSFKHRNCECCKRYRVEAP